MKRHVIKSFAILIAVALLAPAFVALVYARGVSFVTYPRYVTNAVPANDAESDGGPIYRQNNSNASQAPFAVILRVVGYSGTIGYFWLSDDQAGNTVQTYDRFDSGASKNLNPSGCGQGSCWLDESTTLPTGLDGVNITANSFYLMVIGRITGTVSSGPITYTVNYTMSNGDSGSINFASTVANTCVDWYLNWNDTDPESGDPASGADYVELYDNAGNSFTTAPVDGNGYFEVLLSNGANGTSWSAEARSESGSPVRSWFTNISSDPAKCNETIYTGTGGPTRVTLKGLEASAGQRPLLAVAAIIILGLGVGFAFRSTRKNA